MTLWIFLDNIIVWAPSINNFKGLGMRRLQYEMRICLKSHNKVTNTVYVLFEFLWIRRYMATLIRISKNILDLIRLLKYKNFMSCFVYLLICTIANYETNLTNCFYIWTSWKENWYELYFWFREKCIKTFTIHHFLIST